jgi:hypothetical protein
VSKKTPKYLRNIDYPYVEILWRDAMGYTKWMTVSELDDASPEIVSRGWLVKETKKTYFLAGDVGTEEFDEINSIMSIPKGMAVKVTELEFRRKKFRH